jgi:hypothetical protein
MVGFGAVGDLMSNGFQKHDIERLSPSSVNAWIDNPTIWTIRYLGKARDEVGPKAHRGTAVERGFEFLLRGAGMETAIVEAHKAFHELCAGEVHEEVSQHIPAMLKEAHIWRQAHKVEVAATQLRIETWVDGVPVPFIGYVDFTFMRPPGRALQYRSPTSSKLALCHTQEAPALYHF